jgi:hypothetical protein
MTLVDLIGNDAMDGILRADNEFSINPDQRYDRNTFVKHAGALFDLKKYSGQLRKDTNNFDALYNLIGKILSKYVPGDNSVASAIITPLFFVYLLSI